LAATTALFTRLVFHEVSADFALFDLVPEGRNHWVVQVRSGDRLAAHALYWVVAELETSNAVRLAYADDDQLDEAGNRAVPRFKPDWSLELLRSVDYIGSCFAFSGELLYRATFAGVSWGAEGTYGLLLRLVDALERGETVRHIPALLCHHPASQPDQVLGVGSALCAHLERRGVSARVSKTASGVLRVSYDLLQQPLVSIIVPTRDSLEMLHTCLDSVFARSSYRNFEVVLVDNQSVEAATHAYFEAITTQAQVSLLHYAAPFNYSAMNNLGVAEARGEVICLLNNDTEVITPDWLEEMLGHLLQNGVGAVGAKLLYPDGRVQHAGDTVGPGGCAHHLHSFIDKNAPGYCSRAIAAQDLSAVTAACMMTWRWLYLQLGGFDEQQLKVAFNDVDYCLRVREAGYRVVWTPHAQLYHHESASRGKNNTPEKIKHSKKEADYMRKKWRHLMQQDPFYNPNCSYERPDFSLSNAPMVRKPWQRA
jgi:GT2 family glycosyltransferase